MNSTLKTDPAKVRSWQQRSRRRLATHSSLKCNSSLKRSSKRMKSRGKPAPGSVRDLENILDDLTRKVVHAHEKVSFTSGLPGTADDPLEVSHLIGRSFRATRWDAHPEGNCHLQRRSENQHHNKDKSIYRDEFIERHGQAAYDEIRRRADQSEKWTYVELRTLISQRESMLT